MYARIHIYIQREGERQLICYKIGRPFLRNSGLNFCLGMLLQWWTYVTEILPKVCPFDAEKRENRFGSKRCSYKAVVTPDYTWNSKGIPRDV